MNDTGVAKHIEMIYTEVQNGKGIGNNSNIHTK